MENSIMTIERNDALKAHNFKSATIKSQIDVINAALTKADSAVGRIREEYDKARDEAYKSIAPVLASLKANKAHETEGFKTFSEFATACLPISKRQITTLLAYQKKVAEVPALKGFTVANVEAVAPADAAKLAKAIADKEITPETAQTALKDFAQKNPRAATGSGRPTIVPQFTVKAVLSGAIMGERVIKDDFAKVTGNENIVMLPAPKDGSHRRFISYNNDGGAAMYEFYPYVNTATKSDTKKLSVYDQFRAANEWAENLPDDAIQSMFDRMRESQGK